MSQPQVVTKAQYAAGQIRAAILRGDIGPGERLLVDDLAAKFDISATPVREALRALEAEGLVVLAAHRGVYVADHSSTDPTELYELRILLECFATEQAVASLTEDDLQYLSEVGHGHRQAVKRGDLRAASELNRQWHMRLYGRAHRKHFLMEAIERLWNAFPWPVIWYAGREVRHESDFHDNLLEALRARDARVAADLMREHILAHQDFVSHQLAERTALTDGDPPNSQ